MLCETCKFAQTIVGVGFRCLEPFSPQISKSQCHVWPMGSLHSCPAWKLGEDKKDDLRQCIGENGVRDRLNGTELPWEGGEDNVFVTNADTFSSLVQKMLNECEITLPGGEKVQGPFKAEFTERIDVGDLVFLKAGEYIKKVNDKANANAIIIKAGSFSGQHVWLADIKSGKVKLDPAFMEKYGLEGPPVTDEGFVRAADLCEEKKDAWGKYKESFQDGVYNLHQARHEAFDAGWEARGENA